MSVDDVLAQDQVAAMDLDIKGAKNLRGHRRFRSLVVFVHPPTFEELERRLRDRNTEAEDKIVTRLVNAKKELQWHQNNTAFFDSSLINDDLDECYAQFRQVVMDGAFKGGADAAHDIAAFEENAQSR
jgi:guanylate kinase